MPSQLVFWRSGGRVRDVEVDHGAGRTMPMPSPRKTTLKISRVAMSRGSEVAVLGITLFEEVPAVAFGDGLGGPLVELILGDPDAATFAAKKAGLGHEAELVFAGDGGGVDLDELAVLRWRSRRPADREGGLGGAGADDRVSGLAEDGSVATGADDNCIRRERPCLHAAEVHGADAAAGSLGVEDGGEELPAFVLGDFAFGLCIGGPVLIKKGI